MTRVRFLNDLYHHLYGLPQDQIESHLAYYAEMLADRMEEGMSEEEAVAGMEDVETIARRIMEGEGLPYTPPEQRPAVPPSYHDASRLGGGGFTHAYKAPKRWNWRRIVHVALWAVAIFTVFMVVTAMVAELRWQRIAVGSVSMGTAASDVVIDSKTEIGMEAGSPATVVEAIGGITFDSWESADMPYGRGYLFTEGETYIDANSVSGINIEWASGTVCVLPYGGEDVVVQEYSESVLSDRTRMMVTHDDGLLTITYRNGTGLGNVKDTKWLNVMVPDGLMGEINVQTTSAEVMAAQLELDTLRVNTVSGDITCDECYVQTVELAAVSGNLVLNHLHADQAVVSAESGDISGDLQCLGFSAGTVSGDISLTLYNHVEKLELNTVSGEIWASVEDTAIRSIGAESVSGDISLSLPWNMGYTLDFSSVSGNVNLSNFDGARPSSRNGQYVQGDGRCQIYANTTSGDFMIY